MFGAHHSKGSGYLSVHLLKEDIFNNQSKDQQGLIYQKLEPKQILEKNLATLAGREWAFVQLYSGIDNAATTAGANWIGISQDGDPITQNMSTLAGEISTNGLGRIQGTVAHLANTNVAIIDNLFTATANFNNPGIRKGGLFYQSQPGGTAVHLGKISPTVTVLDTQSLKVTCTVNINIPT